MEWKGEEEEEENEREEARRVCTGRGGKERKQGEGELRGRVNKDEGVIDVERKERRERK